MPDEIGVGRRGQRLHLLVEDRDLDVRRCHRGELEEPVGKDLEPEQLDDAAPIEGGLDQGHLHGNDCPITCAGAQPGRLRPAVGRRIDSDQGRRRCALTPAGQPSGDLGRHARAGVGRLDAVCQEVVVGRVAVADVGLDGQLHRSRRQRPGRGRAADAAASGLACATGDDVGLRARTRREQLDDPVREPDDVGLLLPLRPLAPALTRRGPARRVGLARLLRGGEGGALDEHAAPLVPLA